MGFSRLRQGQPTLGGPLRRGPASLAEPPALGRNPLPEMVVDPLPIDEIDPLRQVAVAERLGEPRLLIERQRAPGINRQVEIGVAPRPAGRPRAGHPCRRPFGEVRAENGQYQLLPVCRQSGGAADVC